MTTFSYTGAAQSYTVPAGITEIKIDAYGAQGGDTGGGYGAHASAVLSVTPGEVLNVYVGGAGSPGYQNSSPVANPGGWGANNGGAGGIAQNVNYPYRIGSSGGGASAVTVSGGGGLVWAGGGGGMGYPASGANGGAGGGPNGSAGVDGANGTGETPGGGATQSAGGSAGVNRPIGDYTTPAAGTGSGGGQGGGNNVTSDSPGAGGGGGGGWYGGGGGGGGDPYAAAAGGGGGSSWVTPTGSSNVSYAAGVQSGNGQVVITPLPPLAPTLTSPANASYADLQNDAAAFPFDWTYNNGGATGGETGYIFHQKVSGASSYNFWNASTNAFQSTSVSNTSTATSITFPNGVWTDNTTYNWSVASIDAGGTGPFASDFTVNAQAAPSVTVTAPTGTFAGSQTPTVGWTDTLASGGSQSAYRVVTYPSTVYTASGFTPGQTTGAADDSGTVASSALSYVVATPLPNNVTYRSYVQITQTPGGQLSAWSYTPYTISLDAPAEPTITATSGTDPATGAPRIALAVQGHDNLLSANDASFEGGIGTAVAVTNCTVAQSSAEALDGSYSLAATSTAAGAMSWREGPYPVIAGQLYTAMGSFRAAATAENVRTDVEWYDGATLLSTSVGTQVGDTTTGWTQSLASLTAPATSTQAYLLHNILSTAAASEVHYTDECGLMPGVVTTWTRGGLVGSTTVAVLRSDGLYVRGASTANPTSIPAGTQQVTVYDPEVIPGQQYTYTAVISAVLGANTTISSPASAASGAVSITTTTWWTFDPTNPAGAINLDVQSHQTSRTAQQTAHSLLGPPGGTTYPVVVSSSVGGKDGILTVQTQSVAEYDSVEALVDAQVTMWISSPYGIGKYIRYGPPPGGMSGGGVGNKTHDTQTVPSPATAPIRTTTLNYIGQPRPAV